MKIIHSLSDITEPLPYPCVTIGNFDGVHLGHQILFSEVVVRAHRNKGASIAITFHPHPLKVVRPKGGIKLISNDDQKAELIEMAGIDTLIVLPFTRLFAETPAGDFIDDLLSHTGMKELVIGYDYACGRNREGNIEFLKKQGGLKGFQVTVVEPFYVDDILVSSTKVRQFVAEGRMEEVRKLLGRYYQIRGMVQIGKQRGGPVVGFPTANIHISEEDLCPLHGVYVAHVVYEGRCYGGVMNIGYNPTFGMDKLSAETHIFDFNEDIYGKPIKINLIRHLRGEKRFSSPAELSRQIARDIEEAKRILAESQKELLLSCEERYNR